MYLFSLVIRFPLALVTGGSVMAYWRICKAHYKDLYPTGARITTTRKIFLGASSVR
ncbi:uncharacterized protein BDW43DRAFT_292497 [Aspergillus alliaceus]|uniref:uncharacterized protein n=1 Tax=Petromyces alliaceus TaxID=209559 RepID=UPI0012A485EB|nr:uncharacterized protein BDW43DRAFT_292497 [Aspergillus alliaceus]KAB8228077.1 hypothetical protein BDW43DRAFT_292497 [Aspergillus alliaceus]